MEEPQMIAYIGAITGVVGAITGIAGAVLGFLGYKKSNEIKALDLRLELRRTAVDIQHGISELNKLLPFANESRKRVSAAARERGSGAMKIWEDEHEQDQLLLAELSSAAPNPNDDLTDTDSADLEQMLIQAHDLMRSINTLRDKYSAAIAADDVKRAQIRDAIMRQTTKP